MTSASPSPTVIIIGAGMSGILAAKTLHDSGIQDILILEANSKISFQALISWKEKLTGNLVRRVPTTPLDMVIDYFYNDYEDAEPPRVTSLKNTIPRYEFLDFGDQTYFLSDSRGFESVTS